jgi:hypothetical protein
VVNLGDLTVTRWIAHDIPVVPRAAQQPAKLELSEAPAPKSPTVATFFQRRISGALRTDKRDVVQNPSSSSPVPAAVLAYLAGATKDITTFSQTAARHLYTSQSGSTSPGLLVVADVATSAETGLALLKLEPQDGARAERRNVNGKMTYEVTVLDDLLLTRGTKVFKVALFMESDTAGGAALSGRAADPQNTSGTQGDPAEFFLRKFLGCTLAETPDVSTRRFLAAAEQYANEQIPDAHERAVFTVGLHAEIRSNRTTIRPRNFAQDTLPPDRQGAFVAHLAAAGVPPQGFPKAREAVEKHLAKVSFGFVDGTMVVTTTQSIDNGTVAVEPADGDKTRLQVVEHLDKIRNRAR